MKTQKNSRTAKSKIISNKMMRDHKGNSTWRLLFASATVVLLLAVGANQLLFVSAQTSSDTKEPTDITTLTATAGDAEVKLTWTAATDDTAVTGYKIYEGDKPVGDDGDVYNLPNITTENVTEYVVKNLKNDQPYYFSITALDAAGNESINYSPEATATPKAGLPKSSGSDATHGASLEDNGQAPKVATVTADTNVTVKVEFSEAIKLPNEQPASAFTIQTSATKERLDVQNATIDSSDATGATVILTTAPQTENTEYVVTAGIEIKDFFDNPIVSGTSDTGSFKGVKPENRVAEVGTTDATATTTAETSTELKVISGTADYNDRMQIVFSGPIKLPENTLTALTVLQKGTDKKLNILNVSLSVDGTTIYVITEKQAAVDYEVSFGDIRDEKDHALAADTKFTVTGKGAGVTDTTPPEDVSDFVAKVKSVEKSIIGLQWKPSANTAGDLADYVVYQSEGKNTAAFGDASNLGSNTTSVEVQNLNPGKWYTFKMTAKDTTGNESKGILANVYLPQTGPGMIAAGLTGLAMGWYKRRKNKRK